MNPPARRNPSGPGPVLLALFALVTTLGTAFWWEERRVVDDRLAGELAPWASLPLPERTAPIDSHLADLGSELFRGRCSACHTIAAGPRVGPDLAGVTLRRDYAWIRAMILAPDSMTSQDPDAAALLQAYGVPMPVTEGFGPAHARALLEFLRRADSGASAGP